MADTRKRGRPTAKKEDENELNKEFLTDETGLPLISADEKPDKEDKQEKQEKQEKPDETKPPVDTTSKDPILNDPVVEDEHTKAKATIIGHMPTDIEEPVIQPTVVDFTEKTEETTSEETTETEEVDPPGEVINPALKDATNKEKNLSAKYLVEACINAYCMLNKMGLDYCSFTHERLEIMALNGKFDFAVLDVELPIETEKITIGAFLDSITQQSQQIFVVTEEFKAKASELLLKIFKEKGWGLTPVQALIALVAEDAVPKIQALIVIRSQFSMLIKIGKQIVEKQKEVPLQPKESEHTTRPAQKDSDLPITPTEEVNSDTTDSRGKIKEPLGE